MSVLSGYGKYKRYVLTSTGYKLCSQWTNSNTVHFDDGKTAQTKLGAINGITDSLTATSSNVALSAKAGKNLQEQVTELNTGLADYKNTNIAAWGSNWQGGVTCSINYSTSIRKLFGRITHKVATAPEWGEVVGTLEGITLSYAVPFAVYSTRGQVYNAFVLTTDGKIKVYGSDKSKLTNLNEQLEFYIAF